MSEEKEEKLIKIIKGLWKRARITILSIVLIGVVGYAAWLSHIDYKNKIVEQNLSILYATADSTAHNLGLFINEHIEQLLILSTSSDLRNKIFNIVNVEDDINHRLIKSVYEINKGDVDAIYAIDSQGIVLDRHPRSKSIGKDYSEKPGFKYVSKHKKPYVSEIFKTTGGKYAISLTVPVFDNKRFLGALRWLITSDTIYSNFLVHYVKKHKNETAWILDINGKIISHPVDYHIGKEYLAIHKKMYPNIDWSELETIIGSISAGESGTGLFTYNRTYKKDSTAEKKLIAYAAVHGYNARWIVGVTKRYSDIGGQLIKMP